MAVPKKKNKKVKYQYSIIKKEYRNKIKDRIMTCKYCSLEFNLKKQEIWFGCWNSRKQICVFCINKILK